MQRNDQAVGLAPGPEGKRQIIFFKRKPCGQMLHGRQTGLMVKDGSFRLACLTHHIVDNSRSLRRDGGGIVDRCLDAQQLLEDADGFLI